MNNGYHIAIHDGTTDNRTWIFDVESFIQKEPVSVSELQTLKDAISGPPVCYDALITEDSCPVFYEMVMEETQGNPSAYEVNYPFVCQGQIEIIMS